MSRLLISIFALLSFAIAASAHAPAEMPDTVGVPSGSVAVLPDSSAAQADSLAAIPAESAPAKRYALESDLGKDQGNVFRIGVYRLKHLNWPRALVSFGIGAAIKYSTDILMKKYIHAWRPNGEDDNSMPSRHASTAFSLGYTLGYYLVPYSPWFGLGLHLVADGVAMQRVMSENHYPGDVLAGAGIGVTSKLIGTVIGNWIFGSAHQYMDWRGQSNAFAPSFSVTTGASFPLQQSYGIYELGTAFTSGVRGTFPIVRGFGITADVEMTSAPIKIEGKFLHPLTGFSATVGGAWHVCAGGPFAVTAFAEGGYKRYLKPKGVEAALNAGIFQCGAYATLMLTKDFSVGATASYSASGMRLGECSRTLSSINVGLLTRANF